MVIGLDMVTTWRAGDLNYVALTYHLLSLNMMML